MERNYAIVTLCIPRVSVREYVFCVFFQISENVTFSGFFEMTSKSRKKSLAKV